MRYNSESLEIYVVISRNVLLFKDIKISLGLLITARKMHAQFRENSSFEMSTTTNNLISVSAVEPKFIFIKLRKVFILPKNMVFGKRAKMYIMHVFPMRYNSARARNLLKDCGFAVFFSLSGFIDTPLYS